MAWQLAVSDGGSADKLPPPIFVLVTAMSGEESPRWSGPGCYRCWCGRG